MKNTLTIVSSLVFLIGAAGVLGRIITRMFFAESTAGIANFFTNLSYVPLVLMVVGGLALELVKAFDKKQLPK